MREQPFSIFRAPTRVVLAVLFLLVGLLGPSIPQAWSDDAPSTPAWLATAEEEARREGYALVDARELRALMDSTPGLLLIDARPGYEFERGHIPGAKNLEFDLSDEHVLNDDKRDAFRKLAGNDPGRPIVVYCRSLRCLRSGVGAKWAARLGYANVRRYPQGFLGWKESGEIVAVDGAIIKEKSGESPPAQFPDTEYTLLERPGDAEYLGLPPSARAFRISELPPERTHGHVLALLFNDRCLACVSAVQTTERCRRMLADALGPKSMIPVIGVGVAVSKREAAAYRRDHAAGFPFFADPMATMADFLGQGGVPMAILLDINGKNLDPAFVQEDFGKGPEAMANAILAAMGESNRTDAAARAKCPGASQPTN